MAILSKGITLGYKASAQATTYTNVPNLQSVPDLGGDIEQVDVTCLSNDNYVYIPGIKNFGTLEFGFIFDNSSASSNFQLLRGLETAGNEVDWQVEFNDAITASTGHGTQFKFKGIPHVKTTGVGVNAAVQFTLQISLTSDFEVVNAA